MGSDYFQQKQKQSAYHQQAKILDGEGNDSSENFVTHDVSSSSDSASMFTALLNNCDKSKNQLQSLGWVVGIKVKYEKFMASMFSKFVYTNLRPTHEEVQRIDLPTIDDVELNDDESAFSHDTYPDRSGKRHVVDIHTQSDMDHQGFEDFSTVPPPEILRKAGLSTDASVSQPTKKRRTVRFDTTTVPMQDSEKTPSSISRKSMPIDQLRTSNSERVDAPMLILSSSGKSDHQDSFDQKWNELKFFLKSYESEGIEIATLNALVDVVVNQNPNYSKVETPMTENIHKDHSVNT
ncbi:hypothetical protein T459_31850 [Capsicum annuum]|uniref:Uncharacterized protein n=1 Tax=Capsicum annuum TaxID=4072 RepID=A0A2G2Y3I3_CAPAN|nr:hypothetical protein T459_31850 [Capsicum annuum]